MAEQKKKLKDVLQAIYNAVKALVVQPDYAQNDSTQPDYIKNRTHYVESVSYTDKWNQSNVEVGSGSSSPGAYSDTFTVTAGNKYRVIITNGNNSKTYTDIEAVYNTSLNGNLLNKNWSNPMQGAEAQSDAFYILVQASSVILASVDVYGSGCTVQVSEITENVKKLDRKYLPALNEIDHISSSKSGSVTTVTITETEGATTSFQISDGEDGTDGTNGTDGKSAYQVAVDNGFVGTEAQWLASLKGDSGVDLGEVAVTQTVTTDTDKVPSDKAVYDEVAYPDVVYEKAQDIEGWQPRTSIFISAPNWYFVTNANFACSGLVDVRNYDTVTWRVFTTNQSYYARIIDKNKAYIGAVRISVGGINRQDYPEMGYIFFSCNNSTYNNNDTVNLTLSDGHKIKDDIEETRRDVNQAIANSFGIYTPITFYEGERLTNKTIVIFANQNGGTPSLMTGTLTVQKNNSNYIAVTGMTSYRDDARQSVSLILCFDDEGNLSVYRNGVLIGTAPYTSYPDTGWKLNMTYGALFSHFSLINADLSNYISVIENQGWENWMPNDPFILESGKTYSGTTTKGGWVAPQAFPINALIMATVTATNETSSNENFNFMNVTAYPSESISIPAGESITFTRLIDVKTQRSIGVFGNTNQAGLSTVWSAYQVGFIWGLDYRYAHSRGAYNLNGLVYDDYPIVLSVKEIVPQVLATGAAGSAVGQIRVDTNGNLQMYNGTTWKQINNS